MQQNVVLVTINGWR